MTHLADLIASGDGDRRNGIHGVVTGVVTNNQDPEGLARVRVRFPWLSDADESWWARLATPMAGPNRGVYLLPEVDDEVLVAFEHGDARFPYVLGALWNGGRDAPPESNADGTNARRTITSRSGHVIRLDDTDGEERIQIEGAGGTTAIVLNAAEGTVEITADGDVTIRSGGTLRLEGRAVEIASEADVTVEASAAMRLEADARLDLKGALVNIN